MLGSPETSHIEELKSLARVGGDYYEVFQLADLATGKHFDTSDR